MQSVYEHEPFSLMLGSEPRLTHQPLAPSARGKLIGAYAIAHLGFSTPAKIKWMTLEEIEQIRAMSKQYNPKQAGTAPIAWYGEKCCVHRIAKLLPKNPRLKQLLGQIEREDVLEFGSDPDVVAEPVAASAAVTEFDGPETIEEDVPAAPDPVAAPAPLTLDEACATIVKHRRLDSYRNAAVMQIGQWAVDQTEKKGDDPNLRRLTEAVHLVLEARKAGTITEPAKAAA
jgi:hypothetical protein